MKRFPIVCVLIAGLLFTVPAYSQKFGLGFAGGVPTAGFGQSNEFGAGGYLEGKYGVTEHIELGGRLSVTNFAGSNFVVPFLFTGDYVFVDTKVTPYAGLTLGPYFLNNRSRTEFGIAPRFGVYLGKFDLGLAYHIVSDLSFIGFNFGVVFGGG